MTVFSHSRLACFERCPLKFRFRYIDKVKAVREQGIEAFMGSLVHATLEKLYKDLRFRKANTIEGLLAWFRDEWKRNWSDGILIVRKEYSQENYRRMGEDYIRDYYRRYKPFDQTRTIALEEKVVISLDTEGKYRLRGIIDRLAYAGDGIYEIHDYKTNFNIPVKEYLEDDRQLALYALGVLHNYHDAKRVRLVWHFLSVDKEVVLEKSQEEMDRLKRETTELIDRIGAERRFAPRPGPLCSWCEFRTQCPAQKHIARTEGLPANKYLKEPGVKLVNRYAELKQKEKEFREETGEELARVQEALFRYAEKEGVQVIAGSDVKARAWSKECLRFPGKKEPGREELEGIIKSSGQWENSSMLDTWELEKLVEEGRLPQDVIKKLARFARRERVERIFLSRMDGSPA
jgi:putative RecB family exonuclease